MIAPRHPLGCSGSAFILEVVAVFEFLGIDRSHGAIWNWTQTLTDDQNDEKQN